MRVETNRAKGGGASIVVIYCTLDCCIESTKGLLTVLGLGTE